MILYIYPIGYESEVAQMQQIIDVIQHEQDSQKAWYEHHKSLMFDRVGLNEDEYKAFLTLGRKIERANVRACNGYRGQQPIYMGNEIINRYTDEDWDREVTPLCDKARKLAESKGLNIYFQTDPRGACIYLSRDEMTHSNYNNGYCIY